MSPAYSPPEHLCAPEARPGFSACPWAAVLAARDVVHEGLGLPVRSIEAQETCEKLAPIISQTAGLMNIRTVLQRCLRTLDPERDPDLIHDCKNTITSLGPVNIADARGIA